VNKQEDSKYAIIKKYPVSFVKKVLLFNASVTRCRWHRVLYQQEFILAFYTNSA